MRHRTALTTAVTPVAPEPSPPRHVFGVVAGPDRTGAGVREQDVELFDAAPPSDAAPRAPRHAARPPARRGGLSLPPLIVTVLAAGAGAALPVYLAAQPASPALSGTTVAMPDLPPPPSGPAPAGASAAPTATGAPTRTPAATPTATATVRTAPVRTTTAAPPARTPSAPATSAPPAAPPSAPVATAPPARVPPTRPAAPPSTPPAPPAHDRDKDRDREWDKDRNRDRERPSDGLRVGSSGPDVADVQRALRTLGLYRGPVDGWFSDSLAQSVRRFQWALGLRERSGVCGPLTLAALRDLTR
ncbi:peptidoglycan-binding protein [Streptomyces termitum]|uniref:peptidoglycan-binding protein n=1 Tax=Streptomyces termitum TaxID=67368 RepID=UPI00379152B8